MEIHPNQENVEEAEQTNDVVVRPLSRGKRRYNKNLSNNLENEAGDTSLLVEAPLRRSARLAHRSSLELYPKKTGTPGRGRKRSSTPLAAEYPRRKSLRLSRGQSEEPTTTNHEPSIITRKRAASLDPYSKENKRKLSSSSTKSKKVNTIEDSINSSTRESTPSRASGQNFSSTPTNVQQKDDWKTLPALIYQNDASMLSEESFIDGGELSMEFQESHDEGLQRSDNNISRLDLHVIGDDYIQESAERQVAMYSVLDSRIQQYPDKSLENIKRRRQQRGNYPFNDQMEEDQSRVLFLTLLLFIFIFIAVLIYNDNTMES